MNNKLFFQKGIAAIFLTILVSLIMFAIAISINLTTLNQQKISLSAVKSTQAYYSAEAGEEYALLYLKKNPFLYNPLSQESLFNINIGGGNVNISISNILGGSRNIVSQGNISNKIRKIDVVYSIKTSDNQNASFFYGIQAGNGGIEMSNNAIIKGNVFSDGNVVGQSPANKAVIDNSIVVAGSGNKIENLHVGKDALVHRCVSSTIVGDLTYVSGGSNNCNVGGSTKTQPNNIDPVPLPISDNQVDFWKNEAQEGGIIPKNVSYSGVSDSLGPVKIIGNLIVDHNSILKILGTVYVTGNVIFDNNSTIELDKDSYGSLSGIIVADGTVSVENNAILNGSGESGSYILILSTYFDPEPGSSTPAISVSNNATGAVFYTTAGIVSLENNMTAREITGYKIIIKNGAVIEYESGLQNAFFYGGKGGSWRIEKWSEVE